MRGGGTVESERLARACFDAVRDRDFPRRFKEFLHPEIAILPRSTNGDWIEGYDAVCAFVDQRAGSSVYDTIDERYRPLDEARVIVEGRIRWMDESRVLRDDPVVWAIEFRDGLLYRSIATRSLVEAETALAAGRRPT